MMYIILILLIFFNGDSMSYPYGWYGYGNGYGYGSKYSFIYTYIINLSIFKMVGVIHDTLIINVFLVIRMLDYHLVNKK